MSDPFSSSHERNDTRFKTPQEELEFLRAQIAEKERQLQEAGHVPEREALAHEAVQRYKEAPAHEVLHETHQMSASEIEAISFKLPSDDIDNTVMHELLGVMQESGIKNALSVAERLLNPHLEDDFHRVLVQYIAQGHPIEGLPKTASLWQVLNMTLYEVTLPDPPKEERERPLKEVVSAMEQFYSGMFSIDAELREKGDRYFTIEVAVSGDREDIVFYLAVPRDKEDLFEKQLMSVFPKARARHVPQDYNVFLHDGATSVAIASYKNDAILPLKDYQEFDHDPLSVLINTLTKIAPVGEGAAIQYIVNPVGSRYDKRYRKVLEKLEKGMKLADALKDTPEGFGGEVLKTFRSLIASEKKEKEKREKEREHIDQNVIEQVKKKIATTIPAVNIRLVASAQTQVRADSILSDLISSFNQFHNPAGNHVRFDHKTGKASLAIAKQFTFREFDAGHALPVSVRELTTLMHFPTHNVSHTPQLKRVQAALAPAPIGLPTQGTKLGVNAYRGVDTDVYLTDEDRVRHLYVVGQTGTGKSKFLLTLIKQDIERGAGVCFIDPHGEDVNLILENIPEHRMQDVIYFNPADTERVLGLNMLEYDPRKPEQKTFVINELFSIFKKLYSNSPESMGPAFEQYFRNATALVMEDPATGNTMLDISRVLADAKYREVKLSRCKNPVVNQFWREIATKAQGEASLANIVPYITNKFDIFTANDIMRPIIAQQTSAIRMREIMDNQKILLVNLSKGLLGDINANLLGMVLVGKILMAALSRADTGGTDFPPFYLYIDEFQNITTDSISAILSEARKYKLSLNIAHQFIAQLQEGIRDSVFGNVGSMAIFRVGYEDAEFLENQLAPVFETQDIMNIENQHAYLRMLAHGVPQKPFSIKTIKLPKGSPDRATHIKQLSAQTYGRSKEDVNREVMMRYGISEG
ncbi:MAG: DUF87 domain-containing protein [Candidatus Pacebacteria bacterium]|nr:DUF87 domain-containing protein [Candidatus Paceibacterota bacterium]